MAVTQLAALGAEADIGRVGATLAARLQENL
jgi:hypothetical protein